MQCLKYLVLANMLMQSNINPFDSQEAKPYKNDPEILAMTNLIAAYVCVFVCACVYVCMYVYVHLYVCVLFFRKLCLRFFLPSL